MKFILPAFASLFLIVACNSENETEKEQKETPETIISSIESIDDSLQEMTQKRMEIDSFKVDKVVYHEAINRNKKFFRKYPDHDFAEQALQNVASLYMQIGVERLATKWRDSILTHFPNTSNKIGLLELQMSYYDQDEYDPEKITYYANKLLDIEKLPESKKEMYEFRLEHIDKNFEELIELQMERMNEAKDTTDAS